MIVGAGYISIEFAGIFNGMGADVHLMYRKPLPLTGCDACRSRTEVSLEHAAWHMMHDCHLGPGCILASTCRAQLVLFWLVSTA